MDLGASYSVLPWAVVLAVCAVGSLSTYAAATPLILQLDSTALLGHRLVVAIEPLHESVTSANTEANTTVILLNTTAGATAGSMIYFDSNSDGALVTLDGPEIVSPDDNEETLPPTSTAAVMADSLIAAEVRSMPLHRFEKSNNLIDEDHNAPTHISEYSVQSEHENDELSVIRSRIRDMENVDNVDNFLINFPTRCPPGWKIEHGQCRRPFSHFNDIAKPRSKAKRKHNIKMMV